MCSLVKDKVLKYTALLMRARKHKASENWKWEVTA